MRCNSAQVGSKRGGELLDVVQGGRIEGDVPGKPRYPELEISRRWRRARFRRLRDEAAPNAWRCPTRTCSEPPNLELFCGLAEAQVVIEDWREDYNQHRPHSALGRKAPAVFAAGWTPPARAI
jgi:transposase InsO family protein